MRNRITIVLMLASLAAAGAMYAGTSDAATGARPLTFTMSSVTVHGKELPIKIYSSGAITAEGTWHETTHNDVDRVRIVFPKGTLYVVARENLSWRPNFAACMGKARGGTTWKITGGTGAYRGASGGGTYTDGGTLLGARSADGTCLGQNATPPYVLVTADFVGHLQTS